MRGIIGEEQIEDYVDACAKVAEENMINYTRTMARLHNSLN